MGNHQTNQNCALPIRDFAPRMNALHAQPSPSHRIVWFQLVIAQGCNYTNGFVRNVTLGSDANVVDFCNAVMAILTNCAANTLVVFARKAAHNAGMAPLNLTLIMEGLGATVDDALFVVHQPPRFGFMTSGQRFDQLSTIRDNTDEFLADLLHPFDGLPGAQDVDFIGRIKTLLETPLRHWLPVDPLGLDPQAEAFCCTTDGLFGLPRIHVRLRWTALICARYNEGSQISMLLKLFDDVIDEFAVSFNMRLDIFRNAFDRTETFRNIRPHVCCWANGILLFVGEENSRVSDWNRAIAALSDKLRGISSIWLSGKVPFIFAYVAAGPKLAFFVIQRGQCAIQVSALFDVTTIADRLKVFRTLVNIIRSIRSLLPQLPDDSIPVFRNIARTHRTEIYVAGDCIRKTMAGVRELEDRGLFYGDELRRLYTDVIPTGFRYGCYTPAGKQVIIKNDVLCVHQSPIGRQQRIRTERDARDALKSVLETLAVLHANGLVHRDVRSDNVILAEHGWILIDFEVCAPVDAPIIEQLPRWPEWCTPGSTFTAADDIWMTGNMLHHLELLFVTMEFRRLIGKMMHSDAVCRPSAAEALEALQRVMQIDSRCSA